jgi:ribosome production factor 1
MAKEARSKKSEKGSKKSSKDKTKSLADADSTKKAKKPVKLTDRQRRQQAVDDMRSEKKKNRSKIRRERREAMERGEVVEVPKPITTEDKRHGDVAANKQDPELQADEALDEISKTDDTKVMVICASEHPGERTYRFMQELCFTLPNAQYFKRKTFPLKKIASFAVNRKFTNMIVIQEKSQQPDSMFLVTLPEGPTAYYKISGLRLGSEMKHSVPCNAEHKPEVLVTNFKTRLGLRVGRQLESLFPEVGDDVGRRTIVFHNQRDFIFFRHYRYIFRNVSMKGNEENEMETQAPEEKDIFDPDRRDSEDEDEDTGPKPPSCQLKEIGPRMTLRLRSLQLTGLFDKQNAEYEYMWRPDTNVSRSLCEL